MIKIAVVGKDDKIIEVFDWDRSHAIERPAAGRILDVTNNPGVQVGWTFKKGYLYPPGEEPKET